MADVPDTSGYDTIRDDIRDKIQYLESKSESDSNSIQFNKLKTKILGYIDEVKVDNDTMHKNLIEDLALLSLLYSNKDFDISQEILKLKDFLIMKKQLFKSEKLRNDAILRKKRKQEQIEREKKIEGEREKYGDLSRQFEIDKMEREGKIGGKKSKKLPKKEILGKMRCIYKIPGDRKEYLKHKGKLITVKEYKELMKAKPKKKEAKPKKVKKTKSKK